MIKQTDRNRKMLMEYITTDKSIVQLSKEYGLTRQRVHMIIENESRDEEVLSKIELFLNKARGGVGDSGTPVV